MSGWWSGSREEFLSISATEISNKLSGSKWNKMTKETDGVNTALQERKNGYRVLLTRARKGMVIFVPKGDLEFDDLTRNPEFYNGIYEYLTSCGAKELSE